MSSKNADMSTWVFGGVLFLVGVFLLIGLVIVNSRADDVPTSGTVNNADPTVGALTLNDIDTNGAFGVGNGTLTVTPSTTSLTSEFANWETYGIATDTNGCEDMTTGGVVTGTLCYDDNLGDAIPCYEQTGVGEVCEVYDNVNCFAPEACVFDTLGTLNACSGAGDNDIAVTCAYSVPNWFTETESDANAGWIGLVTVQDTNLGAGDADITFDADPVAAATYCVAQGSVIDFGALTVGENYIGANSAAVPCDIICGGNVACDADIFIDSDAGAPVVATLDCDQGNDIDESQIRWDNVDYDNSGGFTHADMPNIMSGTTAYNIGDNDGAGLGGNAVQSSGAPTTDSTLYFSLDVNEGGGTCTTTTTFTTTQSLD